MSIAAIPDNPLDFVGGNNIRIAIAGLAICKFADAGSTIRFLRHVENHQLKLTIQRKLKSGEDAGDPQEYTIDKSLKTISIAGAEPSEGYLYQPITYLEYELKLMMDLQFLHGHKLTERVGPHVDELTIMTINNCLFYTTTLTDVEFDLVKNGSLIKVARRFGEILGGYMRVAPDKELVITIPGLIIRLPVKVDTIEYNYEIQFNNSCFKADGTPCDPPSVPPESTDFLKIYDILEDRDRPYDQFDLRQVSPEHLSKTAINTGACLPVVEDPCLNCPPAP